MDGFDVLTWARAHDKGIPVIMMTGHGRATDASRAMRAGAYDYVPKPFRNEDMLLTVRHALEEKGLRRQPRQFRDRRCAQSSLEGLMGSSAAVQRIMKHVAQVGPTDFSVLITGETGSGKELVAQAVHAESLRSAQPLVVLDCGSIPETLIESELFGHEKGSFTGAHQAQAGAFELAHGGAIFLDEIGNLPLAMQGKLLRALETRRIHRVGSAKEQAFDFRVIAATNVDLNAAVEAGLFRRDLYHRLAEFSINVPPLRERKEDLRYLVRRTLNAANGELCRHINGLSDAAWEILMRYDWPGNVRELRNQLRRAVLMSDEFDLILEATSFVMLDPHESTVCLVSEARTRAHHTPAFGDVSKSIALTLEKISSGHADLSLKDLTRELTTQIEKVILLEALNINSGNKAKVARILSIDYKTLHNKLKACGITADAPIHRCAQGIDPGRAPFESIPQALEKDHDRQKEAG
ncbi:MAG: sigma-54 dependent transcriptional regulator, partial [Burkholderiales bacterium]